ncbi:hypothetical protein A2W24_02960 [Microgenomates group bacterium RBG_16_45_19]|nr:MAG: hypothetical protein A2W24_02960 [Microgenomates group bacterium RBG_16_45_19]
MVAASREQKAVLSQLITWLSRPDSPAITLGGYAGTGKTTTVALWRKLLHHLEPNARVAFCAYTGKASRVLAATLKRQRVDYAKDSISTIHSLIYAPVTNDQGQITGWRLKKDIQAEVILADEASMVDELIWQDLLSFKRPIIAVGDHGQLPPVNGRYNLMAKPRLKLETIHRQAQSNPIIRLSIMARETGQIPIANYSQTVRKLNRYDSVTGQEVEEILRQYNQDWLILTGFNHTRVKLNQAIRGYLTFDGETPRVGERLICLKNNWQKGIYNGMTGQLHKTIPIFDEEKLHWYEVEITLDDGLIYAGKISAHQFNQLTTLAEFDGLKYKALGDLWDLGYALTVHKAQGSQAPKVLLFEERNQHMSDEDWSRWLYTGVTRAERELTLVGI